MIDKRLFDMVEKAYGEFPVPDASNYTLTDHDLADQVDRISEQLLNLYITLAELGDFERKYD